MTRVSLADRSGQRLRYCVRNRTAAPIVVWHTRFSANHVLRLVDESGRPVPLSASGRRQRADFDAGGPNRDKNTAIVVPPGGIDPVGSTPALGDYFSLQPGMYRLTLEYQDQKAGFGDRPAGMVRLVSLPFSVVVTP